jgi:hypothetical protein
VPEADTSSQQLVLYRPLMPTSSAVPTTTPGAPPPTSKTGARAHPLQPLAATQRAQTVGHAAQLALATLHPIQPKAAPEEVSDASSGGAYGTHYYTYRDEVLLRPGQSIAFRRGLGYYARDTDRAVAHPKSEPSPRQPRSPTSEPAAQGKGPSRGLSQVATSEEAVRQSSALAPANQAHRAGYSLREVSTGPRLRAYGFAGLQADDPHGELASIRLRFVAGVARASNGRVGLVADLPEIDTRGVPDGYEVLISFTATIKDDRTGKERTVTIGKPAEKVPTGEQGALGTQIPVDVGIKKTDQVVSFSVHVSVLHDNTPLVYVRTLNPDLKITLKAPPPPK